MSLSGLEALKFAGIELPLKEYGKPGYPCK